MEKKSTNRIFEAYTEYTRATLKKWKALLTIETHQYFSCSSMEKSNELRPIWVSGTNNPNPQQAMQVPGVNNNPYPQYFVNKAQYQVLPGASNNLSTFGHDSYIDIQQTNLSGQASSSRHGYVLQPASNTFNPYGHGRFTMPSALSEHSHAQHSFHGPGTVRNELGYVTNEARPNQIFPQASNNYSFVGAGGLGSYIDTQHEPLTVNDFSGQASSSRHGYVLQPASNTFNPYGHGRFIMPSALNHASYAQHNFDGSGTIRNELGYVTNEARPNQIFPSASNNYSFVGTGGHGGGYIVPQHEPFTVNNFSGQTSGARHGYVLQPALNTMNPNSRGAFVNSEESVHGPSTDEKPPTGDSSSHQNYDKSTNLDKHYLKNERFKLIYKVINYYKKNASTLHEKNKALFEKSDWLQLIYTNDGAFKADMKCPVCLVNINPMYRDSGSWDFTNVKRHLVKTHSVTVEQKSGEPLKPLGSIDPLTALDNVAKIIGTDCSEQNQTLIKSDSSDEKKESVEPLTSLDDIKPVSVLDSESESSENEDLIGLSELSPQSNTDLDFSFSDDLLTDNSSSSKQSSSDWSSLNTSFSDSSWTDLTSSCHSSGTIKVTKRSKEKQEIELGGSTERVKTTRGKSERNKREGKYEVFKRATSTGAKRKERKDSTTSSDSYRRVETTAGKGKRNKRESNKRDYPKRTKLTASKIMKGNDRERPKHLNSTRSKKKQEKRVKAESTSSSSETDEGDYSKRDTNRPSLVSKGEQGQATPKWRKPGVEYSWVQSQSGKCFPGFIFPELNAKGQKMAQFITLKGELSDINHSFEYKVDYKDLPEKYNQQYATAFKKFNHDNGSNYR